MNETVMGGTSDRIVVWKLNVGNPQYASVRYRCLMPLTNLAEAGVKSLVLSGNEDLRDFRQVHAVIFVKTFSNHDVDLAHRARAAGVPVFFDLCDNVFIAEYGGASNAKICRNTFDICGMAEAVVTTGPAMVEMLRAELPETVPIRVVPDQVERKEITARLLQDGSWRADPWHIRMDAPAATARIPFRLHLQQKAQHLRLHLAQRVQDELQRMRNFKQMSWLRKIQNMYWLLPRPMRRTWFGRTLRDPMPLLHGLRRRLGLAPRQPSDPHPRKTVVWFGHHGSGHGRYGMLTVVDIAHHLRQVDQEIPIRLLVVSDDEWKFHQLFSNLGFPTEFRKWTPLGIFAEIAASDVCIVPNSKDAFSIAKSANRVVMALSLGVPVVATRIPSTEPLEPCIILDDWAGGLRRYLTEPDLAREHLARAADILDRSYSGHHVAATWADLLHLPLTYPTATDTPSGEAAPESHATLRASA